MQGQRKIRQHITYMHKKSHSNLRLLFSLKPKEVAKMKFLSIWIDQKSRDYFYDKSMRHSRF